MRLVADVSDALTEGNVAHGTGEILTVAVAERIGTPSAIWDFACDHCVVEDNVAYGSKTAVRDGGDFDIDCGSKDELVRGNLGFDSGGCCVSAFSAAGRVEEDLRFSHNICLDNATSPSLAPQGAVFFSSPPLPSGTLGGPASTERASRTTTSVGTRADQRPSS